MFCKKIFLFVGIALGCGISVFAANDNSVTTNQTVVPSSIAWMTDYSSAASQAKESNKYLFLFFTGSDWCGWCKKFDSEILSTKEFVNAVGNKFVFVMVDFPMGKPLPADIKKQNDDLKKKFGVTGFPTVVILDSSQNFVAETGYRAGGGKAFADYLMGLLQ